MLGDSETFFLSLYHTVWSTGPLPVHKSLALNCFACILES